MKVSVVITTYNRAPLLCNAIESALAQDYSDFEVIVVDDGSTDDTEQRARDFGGRVRYVYQENKGLSTARNTGISVASGEYIALLDDDDWWMPGKLRLQSAILDQRPELAGTFTNFTIYRDKDDLTPNGIQTWYDIPMDWTNVMEESMTAKSLLGETDLANPGTMLYFGKLYEPSLKNYFVLPSTALFRRSHTGERLRFPPHDATCGDWEFFARISKHAPLCFVDQDTTFNRSHNDEVRLTTRTRQTRQFEMRIDFLERVYKADKDFYQSNKRKVDDVWKERLAQLCKLQLLDLDRPAARITSTKLRSLGGPLTASQRAIVAACSLPGSGWLMRGMRKVKRLL